MAENIQIINKIKSIVPWPKADLILWKYIHMYLKYPTTGEFLSTNNLDSLRIFDVFLRNNIFYIFERFLMNNFT